MYGTYKLFSKLRHRLNLDIGIQEKQITKLISHDLIQRYLWRYEKSSEPGFKTRPVRFPVKKHPSVVKRYILITKKTSL